jgi:hypothetical protein
MLLLMSLCRSLHHSTRFPTDIGRQKSKSSTDCWSGKTLSNYRSENLVLNNELPVGIVSSFCVERSVGNVCIPTDGRLLAGPMRAQRKNYCQYLASRRDPRAVRKLAPIFGPARVRPHYFPPPTHTKISKQKKKISPAALNPKSIRLSLELYGLSLELSGASPRAHRPLHRAYAA